MRTIESRACRTKTGAAKHGYSTHKMAKDWLSRMKKSPSVSAAAARLLQVYRCPECSLWHIGKGG